MFAEGGRSGRSGRRTGSMRLVRAQTRFGRGRSSTSERKRAIEKESGSTHTSRKYSLHWALRGLYMYRLTWFLSFEQSGIT